MPVFYLIVGVAVGTAIGYLLWHKHGAQAPPTTLGATIMARFIVPADQPDFVIQLNATGFKDAEGNDADAKDIDLTVDNSNPAAISGTVSDQTLSEDGKSVSAKVSVHVGAPSADLGVLAYKATNRDTGALVAAGSDEFIVNAGEAATGTVNSSVPLTPTE